MQTTAILIPAQTTKAVPATFNAAGLKSKVYKEKIYVEATDTKGTKCDQPRDEVLVELIVLGADKVSPITPKDILSRFSNIVDDALENSGAELTDGAKVLVDEMIKKGAAVIVEKEAYEELGKADAGLWNFIKKAVKLAQENAGKKPAGGMSFAPAAKTRAAKIELNEEIIKRTQFALCPVFPFC